MENEIEITTSDDKGIFGKIKDWSYENWQTILLVLIVLIVGISAYNYNQEEEEEKNESNSNIIISDENENSEQEDKLENNYPEEEIEKQDEEKANLEDKNIEINENERQEPIAETEKVFSNSNNSEKTYKIVAKKSEGITHLARRALEIYLKETNNTSLTREQKIYAEDYMQNRTGNEEIEIEHQEIFSESLIKDAISNAENLSRLSLNNLTKYIK